ncbi:CPBP family intramembrane glutamic endopeptidase [Smaragdicoccus niigatensis]|uniref:CPBP family intramembrane glutamic endopeptidase n=1 Tax=Smaragdicoccus niigatensis TaxID=359359 RepID=UPI0003719B08|nr:CPBP family intramembrane glutamic endopeptidase [Smaragdicoccus niigatensis]
MLTDRERRGIRVEIVVVLAVTFGLSGARAALSLLQDALAPTPLAEQSVALNQSQAEMSAIDLAWQILGFTQLFAWGALGLYLLWRTGRTLAEVGLAKFSSRKDLLPAVGLALLIGIPGLGLYLVAHALGLNLTVVPTTLNDHWWRIPVLVVFAVANAAAEEIVVVGFLMTRLRDLGWSESRSLAASSLLRGSYHLYQGLGGGLGNVIMGLIFGRYWQVRNRLWPLILAHAFIDIAAFAGYALLHGHISWIG